MSGAEQVHLDVDVDSLRTARYGLQRLAGHLATVATTTTRIPANIGDGWTCPAATVMKAELAGLGAQSTRFSRMSDNAAMALRTFADVAETFQTQTLPRYTLAWDRAESEARSAHDKADRAFDEQVQEASSLPDHGAGSQARAEARNINGNARCQVTTGQLAEMAAMTFQFGKLKAELTQIPTATGDAMAGLTMVAVPDSVAKDCIGHHGSSLSFGWCNVDRSTFPPDLGTDSALAGMNVVKDMHDIADSESATREFNQRFQTGPQSKADIAYLKTLHGDSAAFQQASLAAMDPAILPFMQTAARTGGDAETGMKCGEVITAIAQILAKASNEETRAATRSGPAPMTLCRASTRTRSRPSRGISCRPRSRRPARSDRTPGTWHCSPTSPRTRSRSSVSSTRPTPPGRSTSTRTRPVDKMRGRTS
jgi:hypothetical protein